MQTATPARNGIRNLKIGVIAVAAVVVLIVILQNTERTDTRILFATITMPRAVLLLVMLVVGFVLGLFTAMKTRGVSREADS